MDWEEKREHKRAYIRLSVEYRGKNAWQMIEARDISAGGMFIVTDAVEPPNTEVEIMFEVGEGEKNKKFIHAKGIVAWNRKKEISSGKDDIQPAGMGIKFTKLSPLSAKDFINEVIKKLEENGNAKA